MCAAVWLSRVQRVAVMSASQHHLILHQIIRDFEALASQIERAIQALADDEGGDVDLAALRRAQSAAEKGAQLARNATSDVRRAFD